MFLFLFFPCCSFPYYAHCVCLCWHSLTRYLGSNGFNNQLNDTKRRFTYFVPRDLAWLSLENEMPSTFKKLFMREFSYHVSKTYIYSFCYPFLLNAGYSLVKVYLGKSYSYYYLKVSNKVTVRAYNRSTLG